MGRRQPEHATRHGVSTEEVTQVLLNDLTLRRNRKRRAGDFYAIGATDDGRRVVVVGSWDAGRRTVRPITAYEQQ